MSIFSIVLSNAFVALLTAPLRRLRYLLTVEDDLIEEGVLPPQGFGGTIGCIRFLYRASGNSYSVFYRGAILEALGCIGKYELQRFISIPIARRIPLRMQHAALATTFAHTALVYFTVAPLQTALDTIAVNCVTDFVVVKSGREVEKEEAGKKGAAAAVRPVVLPPHQPGQEAADAGSLPPPPVVRLRFTSAWDTTKHLARHFPTLAMVSRLYLLDFGCRYVTSLANNKILGWLMSKAQKRYNGAEMTSWQRLVLYAGCPLVASLAMSLLTYPFATYPVAHFLRQRCYDRRAEAEAKAAAEEAAAAGDYPASSRHGTPAASREGKAGNGAGHSSGRAASSAATPHPDDTTTVELFWWEELCHRAVHREVRDYLWRSMYGREQSTLMSLGSESSFTKMTATSSRTTTPAGSPVTMSAAAALQCPVGAGGRSSSKRGIGQVYRGFGLIVVSTLSSSALAMTLNRAVDFVLHHSH